MGVTITFCVKVQGDECIPEEEIEGQLEVLHQRFDETEEHMGEIIITADNLPTVKIEDSLDAMIQSLCGSAVVDLNADKSVVIRHYSYYGYLRLDPEGSKVLVSGDFVPTVRIPRKELLQSLHECGKRYISFLRLLHSQDTDYAPVIDELEHDIENAWPNEI